MSGIKGDKAVVLVDPVSSGRFLKSYVVEYGYKLIGIFTLSEEELKQSGKFIPYEEKVKYCDIVINSNDYLFCVNELTKSGYTVIAIIPASEPGVELADQLAEYFNLKGNPACSSLARRDKHKTRLAVKEALLPSPEFIACYAEKDIYTFTKKNRFPVVLKTPKGAGAHHVFICNNLREAKLAFNRILSSKNIFGEPASFALLEEFITGQQYIVEMLGDGESLHVLCIWKVDFQQNVHGKQVFHKIEVIRDVAELQSLRGVSDYALAVGKAVGIRIGPCLAEIRYELNKTPMLIEVGARLSGIDLPLLIREASDFDPFNTTIKVYTSDSLIEIVPVNFSKETVLVFCPVEGTGRIHKIHGIDEIKKLPSYLTSEMKIKEGDYVECSRDLATIPLYVYLVHEGKQEIERDILKVKDLFHIEFCEPEISSVVGC